MTTQTSGFAEFARLNDALAATTRKLEKRALLSDYLKGLTVADAGLAALYFSGTPFAETDLRRLNVGGSLLGKAITQISGANGAAMHDAYRRHGDAGAAAEDLLAATDVAHRQPSLTLAEVESAFAALAVARGPAAKLPVLLDLFSRATPIEIKYLVKLMTGDMRTGVKQALVEEAIAIAYAAPATDVRRAVTLNGSLSEVVSMAATHTLAAARMRLFHPLGFMLASPVDTVEAALARFTEEPPSNRDVILSEAEGSAVSPGAAGAPTGPPSLDLSSRPESRSGDAAERPAVPPTQIAAQIEDKYDGIRAQLHCGDPTQPGRVRIFSRNREDISDSFPELIEAFAAVDDPVILDGEVLAWSPTEDRALPFAVLAQRFGRKRVTPQMRESLPVLFMAFDLLYRGDSLLLDEPLSARRAQLEDFARSADSLTAGKPAPGHQTALFAEPAPPRAFPRLRLSAATPLSSAEQLDRSYAEARARSNEGVMIKSLASKYQPGRRGLAWLKLKRELATLDVVVTGAEYGNGRRARVLSDYTFAVRDGDDLKNVGKAYSGLTDAEIEELTAFLKAHTLEDFGTFRTVEPLVILEVAFNNVMRSSRHNSGFALRFPRIVRIRTDKPLEEIDTLARVEEIYQSQPDKPIEE